MTELTRARIEEIRTTAPRMTEGEIDALCTLATKALAQADALPPDLAAIAARNAARKPGPWWTDAKYSGQERGCAVIAARTDSGPLPGNPTRGMVCFVTALLNTEARLCEDTAKFIAHASEDIPSLLAEVARLTAVIEHDRSKVVDVLAEANAVLKNYGWLAEGRGSYAFDDDRWKDEFKVCMDSLAKVLDPMRGIASDLSDSPIKWADIVAARSMTDALAEAEKRAARFEEALTASENTKAAYIGEFEMGVRLSDGRGNEQTRSISVDWVTIKKIMSAIKARALTTGMVRP